MLINAVNLACSKPWCKFGLIRDVLSTECIHHLTVEHLPTTCNLEENGPQVPLQIYETRKKKPALQRICSSTCQVLAEGMTAVIRMIESNMHRHVGAPPASVSLFSILVFFFGFHFDRTALACPR